MIHSPPHYSNIRSPHLSPRSTHTGDYCIATPFRATLEKTHTHAQQQQQQQRQSCAKNGGGETNAR